MLVSVETQHIHICQRRPTGAAECNTLTKLLWAVSQKDSFKVPMARASCSRERVLKIVYSITSNGNDSFSRMLRVSVASVRLTNKDATVSLVSDAHSVAQLRAVSDPVLKEVDAVVAVPTPDGEDSFRNRFVKTQLRDAVAGPFLYLDADTLVRGSLEPIFGYDTDFAAAPNHSQDTYADQVGARGESMLRAMGWQAGPIHYFNAGVIFMRDTAPAFELARIWHQRWLESVQRLGLHFDQPALNCALRQCQTRLLVLPHRFNAQVMEAPDTAKDAVVWHLYSSTRFAPFTAYGRLLKRLEQGTPFNTAAIRDLLQRGHPWPACDWLDGLVAASVANKSRLGDADFLWFEGRRAASVSLRLRRALRLMFQQIPGGERLLSLRRITGKSSAQVPK